MTDSVATVIEQIAGDPSILGLGDLDVVRVLPSCEVGQARLLLEEPAHTTLYIVEVLLGPVDDRALIRVVEQWAAVRQRHSNRRCFAVLLAGLVEPRCRNIMGVIGRAVPLVALEMQEVDGVLRFSLIKLR